MPIAMVCPQCSARFSFADDWAGKRARCQRCDNIFTIDELSPPVLAKPLDVELNLELIEDPPKSAAPLSMTLPEPEVVDDLPVEIVEDDYDVPDAPPKARPRSAERDTSPDDFDADAFGGKSRGRKPPPRPRSRRNEDEEEDERISRRRSSRREEDDAAFNRMQRRSDEAERGDGMGIRGGKYPLWLKFIVLVAVYAITAGQKIYWLENRDQGALGRMKKRLIGFAIFTIVFLLLGCGGMLFFIFSFWRNTVPPPSHHVTPGPGPRPQPGPPDGDNRKPVEVAWAAVPDPLPDWNKWKAAGNLTIPMKNNERVWYPDRPSKFLAVGPYHGRGTVTVWNLVANKIEGTINDVRITDKGCLSFDGQYLAMLAGEEINVYATKTGRQVNTFRLPERGVPFWVDFHAADRLIATCRTATSEQVWTWDLKTGTTAGFSATLQWKILGSPTLSPNGRYFAYLSERSLELHDLQKGGPVNRLPVMRDPLAKIAGCQGLSFSPDGLAIAALINHGADYIMQWEMTGGAITQELKGSFPGNFPGRRIEWLPENRGWLIQGGSFINPAGDLSIKMAIDPLDRAGLRRIINNEQLLTLRRDGTGRKVIAQPIPR